MSERSAAAGYVNSLLHDTGARPRLVKHDALDWHLHVTRADAPLADRIGAEAAMGFLALVVDDALDRVGVCAAPDCDDLLVDLSRNRSKQYCDRGSCGNRLHVAAYRTRRRSG